MSNASRPPVQKKINEQKTPKEQEPGSTRAQKAPQEKPASKEAGNSASPRRIAAIRETSTNTWGHLPSQKGTPSPSHIDAKNLVTLLAQQVAFMDARLTLMSKLITGGYPPHSPRFEQPAASSAKDDPSTPLELTLSVPNSAESASAPASFDAMKSIWEQALRTQPDLAHSPAYANFENTLATLEELKEIMGENAADRSLLPVRHLTAMDHNVSVNAMGNLLKQGFDQGVIPKTEADTALALDKIYHVAQELSVPANVLARGIEAGMEDLPKEMQNAQGFDHLLATEAARHLTGKKRTGPDMPSFTHAEAHAMGFLPTSDTSSADTPWTAAEKAEFISKTTAEDATATGALAALYQGKNDEAPKLLENLIRVLQTLIPNLDALLGEGDTSANTLAYLLARQETDKAEAASTAIRANDQPLGGLITRDYTNWKSEIGELSMLPPAKATTAPPRDAGIANHQQPSTPQQAIAAANLPQEAETISVSPFKQLAKELAALTEQKADPASLSQSMQILLQALAQNSPSPEATTDSPSLSSSLSLSSGLPLPNLSAGLPGADPASEQAPQNNANAPHEPSMEQVVDALQHAMDQTLKAAAMSIADAILTNSADFDMLWDKIWWKIDNITKLTNCGDRISPF